MMRQSNVLPALAASGFAMGAVLAGAAFAQTAVPAPSAAEATADALKKAATGAVAKPSAQVPAAPAADAAAAAPKPSAIAKAKAMLPWDKAKAAKAAAAGEAAPTDAAKADTAAATEPAKPAARAATTKSPAAAKAASAGVPVRGANGEVMSGPMAATHAFFGANTYAAPAPSKTGVRPGCTRLAHSSIDVGKDNPIKFSREGIDNQIAALTKTKGWKSTSKSDEKIICTEYVNLGLFGQEYTCRVETTVCPK
jgi:hypothetical protein